MQGIGQLSGLDQPGLVGVFQRIMSAWRSLGLASLGIRPNIDADGGAVTIFATAPEGRLDDLRRLFARFALLDGRGGAEVSLPEDAAAADLFRQDWGAITLSPDCAGMATAGGVQLCCRGVWPGLAPQVMEQMSALGRPCWRHVNLVAATPAPDGRRRWAKALLDFDGSGAPLALQDQQRQAVKAAAEASVNLEAWWSCAPEDAEVLADLLNAAAHAREPPAFGALTLFTREQTTPDPVIEGLHSRLLYEPEAIEQMTGFATEAEAAEELSWPFAGVKIRARPPMPPAEPDLQNAPDNDDEPPATGAHGGTPGLFGVNWQDLPPIKDSDNFLFISYAHSDATTVYNVLRQLDAQGVPYWYDRGIPPGIEWDDELEERLARSSAVVAFLSGRSLSSRYCRREIKYADILGKTIAPVALDQAMPTKGLAFILSPVQVIPATDPHLISRLSALK